MRRKREEVQTSQAMDIEGQLRGSPGSRKAANQRQALKLRLLSDLRYDEDMRKRIKRAEL
ncbi:hypothetical protein N7451_007199 [Penicillium sp. IBT 35674x]|nr:hypothetical protein N7451_007199 [Penicillium sp. IBT 35674x]